MTFANSVSLNYLIKLADYFQCSIDSFSAAVKVTCLLQFVRLFPFPSVYVKLWKKRDTRVTDLLRKYALRKAAFTNGIKVPPLSFLRSLSLRIYSVAPSIILLGRDCFYRCFIYFLSFFNIRNLCITPP